MSVPSRIFALVVVFVSAWSGPGRTASAGDPPPADRAEVYRRHGMDPSTSLESRIGATPASVLELFKADGFPAPSAHALTESEQDQLRSAIAALPPLHRRILRERLRTLSFLDGMPNTALTSTVNPGEPFRLYDITFNAAILRQNVSEWLTKKERTCFDAAGSRLSVSIDAGTKLEALVYVLLHEATHVVDGCLQITPALNPSGRPSGSGKPAATAFTEGIWIELSRPVPRYQDPLRESGPFHGKGRAIPVDRAKEVYEALRKTPFVSLYGGRNWLDDLAEYVTVYHLNQVLNQPFRIVVRDGEKPIFEYEPMKSDLVRGRVGQMKRYYENGPGAGATPGPSGTKVGAAGGGR